MPQKKSEIKESITKKVKGAKPLIQNFKKEIKVLEDNLKRSREQFSLIYDNVSDLIFLMKVGSDDKFVFESVNHSYCKATGFKKINIIGKSLDEILPEDKFLNVVKNYRDIISKCRPAVSEEIWSDIPGKYLEVEVTLIPIADDKGKCTHILGSARDISERKKREQNILEIKQSYQNLFNTVSEAIYIQNINGEFIDVNQGAINMYGYSREEFLGKTPLFLSAPGKNDMDDTLNKVKKAYEGETQLFNWWGKRKNGQIFPKEVILNKGVYMGQDVIIATARDITDRVNADEKLKIYMKELQELNLSKDKFFSIIAHDLRSPFNGLLGFSKVLSEEFDQLTKDEIREFIEYVHSSAKTVYNLVDNLLQWTRIHTGKMEYQPIKIDLHDEAYKIINLFTSNAITKKIMLINEIPVNTYVFADQNMLQSIFQNIISNSIKFTNQGGKVTIKSLLKNGYYEVHVIDTGIGISEENIHKLFRIDEQFSTYGTNNEEGSGLGMILCKELVEKNGGQIKVESELGRGSSFIFTIPSQKTNINIHND